MSSPVASPRWPFAAPGLAALLAALGPACAEQKPQAYTPRITYLALVSDQGRMTTLDGWKSHEAQAVLAEQAARDLGCNPRRMRLEALGPLTAVGGCPRRGLYATIGPYEFRVAADATERPVQVIMRLGYALVTDEDEERQRHTLGMMGAQRPDVRDALAYVDLVSRAWQDLRCARDEILPAFVPAPPGSPPGRRVPTAVGCGRRATYAPVDAAEGGPFELVSLTRASSPGP